MLQEAFNIVHTDESRASTGTGHRQISEAVHPDLQSLHNAKIGSIVGAGVGMIIALATLSTIGFSRVPGAVEAAILFFYAGLGGAILGVIFGATGAFGNARVPSRAGDRHGKGDL